MEWQSWNQLGNDIDGEAGGDRSGWSVSLSADGTILAIGASENDGNSGDTNHNSGHTHLPMGWQSWNQLGSDIDGKTRVTVAERYFALQRWQHRCHWSL